MDYNWLDAEADWTGYAIAVAIVILGILAGLIAVTT